MQRLKVAMSKLLSRQSVANLLVFSFILFTAIGTFLFNPALGFIVFGVTSGVVGYLLGLE